MPEVFKWNLIRIGDGLLINGCIKEKAHDALEDSITFYARVFQHEEMSEKDLESNVISPDLVKVKYKGEHFELQRVKTN